MLACELQAYSCFPIPRPSAKVTDARTTVPGFYMGARDLNSVFKLAQEALYP